jgi:hypothetical protein
VIRKIEFEGFPARGIIPEKYFLDTPPIRGYF